jgi:AcrR family transcriptional regulator
MVKEGKEAGLTTGEQAGAGVQPRPRLNTERVLAAAVEMADKSGVESVTMRALAQRLGVEAMALYNHVVNKEEMLDGMVDVVLTEINDATAGISGDWKNAMRQRVLAAREVFLRHRWAPGVLESRMDLPASFNRYYDSVIGLFREGGFSTDLTHHGLHALGSRVLGFTQEPWDDSQPLPDPTFIAQQMAGEYPNIAAMLIDVSHEADTTLGWCDDQVEFEFALDLLLDGLERLRDADLSRAGMAPKAGGPSARSRRR